MLFIPLGLYSRIYKIPWATSFLVLLILVISFANFENVDQIEKVFFRSQHQYRILEAKLKMLDGICLAKKVFSKSICNAIHSISEKPIYAFSQPIFEIKSQLTKSVVTKNEITKLQSILYSSNFFENMDYAFEGTQSYQNWQSELSLFEAEQRELNKAHNFLSRANLNFLAITKAQFMHAGLLHLLGNLMFFCFLSIFVELRVGSLLYSIIFLLSGYFGLGSHLAFQESQHMTLLGASANIAGVAGAFSYFFWQKNLRVFFSVFFMYAKTIPVPVYFFFPVLMLAGDLTGALSAQSSTGVAHLAHLGGYLFGLAIAFIIQKMDNLPSDFYFFEEFLIFEKAKKLSGPKKLEALIKTLEINPENQQVHYEIWNNQLRFVEWKDLNSNERAYTQKYLGTWLKLEKINKGQMASILEKIPPTWDSSFFLNDIEISELKSIYEKCESLNMVSSAYIILSFLFRKHPKLGLDQNWQSKKIALENQMKGRLNGQYA